MTEKVLVGCPTSRYHDYCIEEYAKSITSFSYPSYDILLVDNSEDLSYFEKLKKLGLPVIKDDFTEKARDRIVHSRNILKNYALEHDYDYFLSLEQDIIPPRDVIERTVHSQKDIISGVYFKPFHGEFVPLASKKIDQKTFEMLKNSSHKEILEKMNTYHITSYEEVGLWMTAEEVEEPKVIEIHEAGLGCVLISRKVLEKIEFRYDPHIDGFDDTWFYHDARKAGFKAFIDTSIKCKHLLLKKPWKWADLER